MFKVIRPLDIPASLGSKRNYDGEDVYKALLSCFHNKCYLCEAKNPHDINIEHFIPHRGDVNKKFDWGNLYLACSRCNNIKLAGFDLLLDCCESTTDVSLLIKLIPPHTPYSKKVTIEALSNDTKTLNTAKLLDKIYNSEHTVNKEITGSFLRRKIYDQLEILLRNIRDYIAPDATPSEKEVAIEKMKLLSSPESEFSAFMKHSILDDQELNVLVFNNENQ